MCVLLLLFESKYQVRWNPAVYQCVFVLMASNEISDLNELLVLYEQWPASAIIPQSYDKQCVVLFLICPDPMNVAL